MPASVLDSQTLFIAALSSEIPYMNSSNRLLFHFSTFSDTVAFESKRLQQYAKAHIVHVSSSSLCSIELHTMIRKERHTLAQHQQQRDQLQFRQHKIASQQQIDHNENVNEFEQL